MNEITTEKTMTTKELAETLGVDVSTVTKIVKRLEKQTSEVLPKFTQGQTVRFNEKQATLIKQEIAKHHNLASRQIDSVTTELEENNLITNAFLILRRRNTELKQRAEIAENALDRIANGKGRFSMSQTAKALKLPYGRNRLFVELRKMEILKNNNEPYQNQIDEGHFITIVKTVDNGENKLVTLTTSKGLVYLAKKFNAQIDQSVQADY